jgi:ATP-dependent Clp protease ATP-binding subunit ClpX
MVAVARIPTAPELVAHLDRHVVGQRRAKRRLAMAVYRHYLGLRLKSLAQARDGLGRQHQLLLGPTGVGKSLLVRSLTHVLGVPTAFVSAPSLVETGYVGTPVEAAFSTLLERAQGDAMLAEHGIVFLDEFDKLRRAREVGRDVSGEGVQNGLLTLLDGRPVRVRYRDREVTLDSSQVLFLCTGAFTGLTRIVRERLSRAEAGLGFRGRARSRRDLDAPELLVQVTPEDLERFGFIPELVGRFAGIVALDPLSREELDRVLADLSNSPLQLQGRMFELHGVRLEVPADARAAIVDRRWRRAGRARAAPDRGRSVQRAQFRLPDARARAWGLVRMTLAAVESREPELVPASSLGASSPRPRRRSCCRDPSAAAAGSRRNRSVRASHAGARRDGHRRPSLFGPES